MDLSVGLSSGNFGPEKTSDQALSHFRSFERTPNVLVDGGRGQEIIRQAEYAVLGRGGEQRAVGMDREFRYILTPIDILIFNAAADVGPSLSVIGRAIDAIGETREEIVRGSGGHRSDLPTRKRCEIGANIAPSIAKIR